MIAAAALLAGIVTVAAAALVPGSPIRSWIADRTGGGSRPPSEPSMEAPHLSVLAPQRVDVAIAAPSDSLRIQVSLSTEPWLEVRTGPGEALERIRLDEGRLTVAPGSARSLGITLPARSQLRILIGGDTLLSRTGTSSAAVAEWTDTSILVLPATSGGDP